MMKNFFGGLLAMLLGTGLVVDYGIGVVHSFNKHGIVDGVAGMILFPWALYRGAEFWWHDDYADVNWDKRLPKDIKTCTYFFAKSEDPASNSYQINEDVEKFSNKINKYPKKQLNHIKDACIVYLDYADLVMVEMRLHLQNQKFENTIDFESSATLSQLKNKLMGYNLSHEVEMADLTLSKLTDKISFELKSVGSETDFDDKKRNFIDIIDVAMKNQRNIHKKVFRDLFNEEYIESKYN